MWQYVTYTYVYLGVIHIDVWQKPTQFCKAFILQLKNNFKKVKEGESPPPLCAVVLPPSPWNTLHACPSRDQIGVPPPTLRLNISRA